MTVAGTVLSGPKDAADQKSQIIRLAQARIGERTEQLIAFSWSCHTSIFFLTLSLPVPIVFLCGLVLLVTSLPSATAWLVGPADSFEVARAMADLLLFGKFAGLHNQSRPLYTEVPLDYLYDRCFSS